MEPQLGSLRRTSPPQQPNCLLRPAKEEAAKATNARGGSYGVSIRVQGIDGHPYIVLNNTERSLSEHASGSVDGQQVALEAPNRSKCNSSGALELERKADEDRSLGGTNNVPPGVFQSSKQVSVDVGEKSVSHFKTRFPKSSSLLNFQRHPELLQPYDPEKSILNLEAFQPPRLIKSQSLPDEEETDSKPWSSALKVMPLETTTTQIAELFQSKPKTVNLTKAVAEEDLSKKEVEDYSVITSPSEIPESPSPSDGSPYDVSPPGYQEMRKCRPDLLPFRRQDSTGSVLNSSRRSSSSSTTPTSVASLYKFFLDDQEYAIYADHVNRHENRRYVPFLPGTGRDIDKGATPPVDQLIEKFDRKLVGPQRRGRLGFRNRIHPDDRKRSRSVDSALSGSLKVNSGSLDEFSKGLGTSSECLSQPSRVCLQKPFSLDAKSASVGEQIAPRAVGKLQAAVARDSSGGKFNSLQYNQQSNVSGKSLSYKSSTLPIQNKKSENKMVASTLLVPNRVATQKLSMKTFAVPPAAAASNAQVTPDLLKDQQERAHQTNEETAKQILYNYLKEGSSENDDATKRKVNLVFEKIQTLKSRAAGSTQVKQVSDAPTEVRALMEQKQQLEKQVVELRRKLDLEARNQQNFKAERDAASVELQNLQQRLEESEEEKETFRRRLEDSEKDLRLHLEELFQVKMEREQHQTEIRDLQEQLSEMHDELDSAKQVEDGEKRMLLEELVQLKQDLQALLGAKEQQEEILRKRERELTALKGALKEEVSGHDLEVEQLKEQHGQELQALQERLEAALKRAETLSSSQRLAEEMQSKAEEQLVEMAEQNQWLKETLAELEKQQGELQQDLKKLREEGSKRAERIDACEKEKQNVEETMAHMEEEVQALALAKASLEAELEEAQKDIVRLNQEQKQLSDRLKEEATQKDQLKRMKSELEKERWQLDKAIEKLHEEMAEIMEVSRASTLELQNQLDEYKEKNRRELAEAQRQLKDKNLELEKAHLATLKMQEEVRYMEEELRDHQRAQDEAITKTQLLEQTVKALEYELEAKNHLKEDRARQTKIMEDKMAQLELELEEERNNSEILSERIRMCREQVEQMRSDLLQERTLRQDLECDKISLERQNKDLKSRILHLEGSYRSSKEVLLVQMEARILELEEKLESEERDRGNLQLSNRRLERKVKELLLQVDDEHLSLTDQKDQLSLRLKAMKRQVEEAEEEIDRLESSKKKLQRELEEQVDLNDQLQAQLNAIKKELRRKKVSSKMLCELDDEDEDDDFSTDGESLYDAPSGFRFLKDEDIKS